MPEGTDWVSGYMLVLLVVMVIVPEGTGFYWFYGYMLVLLVVMVINSA